MNTMEMIAYSLIGIALLCAFSSVIYLTTIKKASLKKKDELDSHPASGEGKKEGSNKYLSLSFVKGLPTLLMSIGFVFTVIAIVLLINTKIT